MRRMRALAIVSLTLLLTLGATAGSTPAVGQKAPDFQLNDQNGKTVRLSSLHGRKVVLVFYRGDW